MWPPADRTSSSSLDQTVLIISNKSALNAFAINSNLVSSHQAYLEKDAKEMKAKMEAESKALQEKLDKEASALKSKMSEDEEARRKETKALQDKLEREKEALAKKVW